MSEKIKSVEEFIKERDRFIQYMEQMIKSLRSEYPHFENRWYYVSALNNISFMALKMINATADMMDKKEG